jgi:hypothetical protein
MAKAGHIRRFGKIPALNRNLCGVKCMIVFEIQNPKHETNTKSEFSIVQNVATEGELSGVLVI